MALTPRRPVARIGHGILEERVALYHGIEFDEFPKQVFHHRRRPGVGTVRKGTFRLGVGFHEQSRDPRSHGRPGQHGHHLTLAAGLVAQPARHLHRMRGIEYHGAVRCRA